MRLFSKTSKNHFQSVINEIQNVDSKLSSKDFELIKLLNDSTLDDFIKNNGELYFKHNYSIYYSRGKKQFFNILQNTPGYWEMFKSDNIRKAIQNVNSELKLWFIGKSFSSANGEYAIFEGELELPKLFNILEYQDNLAPQIWRDIKSYREKGIVDLKTNEGILGTEVGITNEIVTNHWDFNLTEESGRFILEVVSDGVAVVLWRTELNDEEILKMKKEGLKYIKEIAEIFRYSPDKYEKRKIKYYR